MMNRDDQERRPPSAARGRSSIPLWAAARRARAKPYSQAIQPAVSPVIRGPAYLVHDVLSTTDSTDSTDGSAMRWTCPEMDADSAEAQVASG